MAEITTPFHGRPLAFAVTGGWPSTPLADLEQAMGGETLFSQEN